MRLALTAALRPSIRLALHVLALACALAVQVAFAGGLAPGDYEFRLTHQGLSRSYLLHVPPQATAGRALPLVMVFHGGGSNAEVIRGYTRFDRSADRDGYIAVYPNGSSGIGNNFLTWNAGNCCGPAATLKVDDVGYALEVLDDVAARLPVDRARVYATGLSNGAMMAYRLAAEASPRIAAVAGVAGTMALERFAPTRPMPVLHIHSVNDHIARFDGGFGPPGVQAETRVHHMSVEALLKRWLDHNQCAARPSAVEPLAGKPGTPDASHSVIRRVHSACSEGTSVVLLQLSGPGHVWPGGTRDYLTPILGTGTAVIDANSEIWRFFSRYRR